jgi:hypothetical protein
MVSVLGTLLSAASFTMAAHLPVAENNPYADVVHRNIFGLREPVLPPSVLPETPATKDKGDLILTGIVDFRKAQWALLTLTERGIPPRRYTLTLGQKEDDVEVLAVDAVAATVRVRHGSAEVLLTFDKHDPTANQKNMEEIGRKYVQQAKPFVDEHTHAHAAREQREAERRELERAAAEKELAARKALNQP